MTCNDEILMQIYAVGNALKVTAVDAASGVEVSFVAAKNTPSFSLKMMAKKKLSYVMAKNNQA